MSLKKFYKHRISININQIFLKINYLQKKELQNIIPF